MYMRGVKELSSSRIRGTVTISGEASLPVEMHGVWVDSRILWVNTPKRILREKEDREVNNVFDTYSGCEA